MMKNIRFRLGAAIALILCLALLLTGCDGLGGIFNRGGDDNGSTGEFNIVCGDIFLNVDDTYQLYLDNADIPIDEVEWLAIGEAVTV